MSKAPVINDNKILCRINQLIVVDKNVAKSLGPHIAATFKGTRLFGGQIITQTYLAFKKLFNNTQVLKVDTIFIAPGNIIDPIEFNFDKRTLEYGFTKISITQKDKLIATSVIRFTKNLFPQLFLINSTGISFPNNINLPEFYDIFDFSSITNGLFQFRPVSLFKSEKETTDIGVIQTWAHLNSELQIPKFDDPLTPLLLLSDYFVFRPVFNLYHHYEQGTQAMFGSTLNHKITIHHTDVDQNGYFFVQIKSHIISRNCGIIDGQIFDEKHRCILAYRQQNFIQF